MPHYRENEVYKILEEILTNAGMRIYYQNVPDDSIDGAIWARSDEDSASIMITLLLSTNPRTANDEVGRMVGLQNDAREIYPAFKCRRN